jgi:hypothetical protein
VKVKRAAALLAVLCVAATGCQHKATGAATPTAPRDGSAAQSSAPSAMHPTVASNKRAAVREADRLLREAVLPKSATPLHQPLPHALAQPNMGFATATSTVDHRQAWQVAMSMPALARWIEAHGPAHLLRDGSSGSSVRGRTVARGFSFTEVHKNRAWESAGLIVSIAPLGPRVSAVRTDGIVVWLDPRPLRDTARGRRVHLRVSDPCPLSITHVVGVRNPDLAVLHHALLPPGRPSAGVVCSYRGARETSARQTLDAAAAAHFATAVRRLRLAHADGEVQHCAMLAETPVIVALSYGTGDIDLWLPAGGCARVGNGWILSGGFTGYQQLAGHLARH